MANESDIQLLTGGSGPLIRTLTVTTLINGVLTPVQMEVAAISDENGQLLSVNNFNLMVRQNQAIIVELRAIRQILAQAFQQTVVVDDEFLPLLGVQ